jgi:AbrB family looped-hinge helix DNA binding protein
MGLSKSLCYCHRMAERPSPYGDPVRARLTRQGQITVPKAVREALGALPGDELTFEQRPDGVLLGLAPTPRLTDMVGAAAVESWPWTEDDIERMVTDEVGRSYLRKVARMVDQRRTDHAGKERGTDG